MIVAIDGVAGSGKTTVSRIVARRLGFVYIYSGAIYRALALKFIQLGMNDINKENLKILLKKAKIKLKLENSRQITMLDKKPVDDIIHSSQISDLTSRICEWRAVHEFVHKIERKYVSRKDIVIEGREIGSAVFPNADVKFFLTATPEARARRRLADLKFKHETISFEKLKKQIIERDRRDFERKDFPLVKVPDAIEIDSSNLTIAEVVDIMTKEIKKRM